MEENNWLDLEVTVAALMGIVSVLRPPTFAHNGRMSKIPTSLALPRASRTLPRPRRRRQMGNRACPESGGCRVPGLPIPASRPNTRTT